MIGRDIGELAGIGPLGLTASADRGALFAAADVVIDFTVPAATAAHAALAAEHGKRPRHRHDRARPGADPGGRARRRKRAPIVWAPNMSPASPCCIGLVEQAARRLGADYDIEVLEMHHRHKIDAPSGTALALGRAAAAGRGIDLDARSAARPRRPYRRRAHQATSALRRLRGGDVVGDHTVIFAGEASGSSSRTAPRAAGSSPAARSAPPAGSPASHPGSTT